MVFNIQNVSSHFLFLVCIFFDIDSWNKNDSMESSSKLFVWVDFIFFWILKCFLFVGNFEFRLKWNYQNRINSIKFFETKRDKIVDWNAKEHRMKILFSECILSVDANLL